VVAALFAGRRARLALVCAAATTLTHAALHFAGPRLLSPHPLSLTAAEAFVTLAEAGAYTWASGELGRSLVASALANGLSFAAGWLVL
jgi:hypothetical protein